MGSDAPVILKTNAEADLDCIKTQFEAFANDVKARAKSKPDETLIAQLAA